MGVKGGSIAHDQAVITEFSLAHDHGLGPYYRLLGVF